MKSLLMNNIFNLLYNNIMSTKSFKSKTKSNLNYNESLNDGANTDHIYYNLLITNLTDGLIPAEFNENRGSSIIDTPRDYFATVTRFYINCVNSIPLFVFQPQPGNPLSGNTCPNLGIYSFTMTYNNIDYEEFLIYNSRDITFDINVFDWNFIQSQNVFYYSVFNVQSMIDFMNQTLKNCYNRVPNTAPPKIAGAPAPFINYDPNTSLITFYAHRSFDPNFVGVPTIEIWCNTALSRFLTLLNFVFTDSFAIDNKNFQFSFFQNSFNTIVAIPPDINYPIWQSQLSYLVGEGVFLNGQNYLCTINTIPGNSPPSANWTTTSPFQQPPYWNFNTAYVIGNIVFFNGLYYICIINNTASAPSESINWNLYDGFTCYKNTTEVSTIYCWPDLTSIVFVSPNLSAFSELTPKSNFNNPITNINQNNSTQQILTDFVPDIITGFDVRTNIVFFNQGEYRLLNLSGDTPLRSINIQVFWTDRSGNLFPIILNPGGLISVKILFRKKNIKSSLMYEK